MKLSTVVATIQLGQDAYKAKVLEAPYNKGTPHYYWWVIGWTLQKREAERIQQCKEKISTI